MKHKKTPLLISALMISILGCRLLAGEGTVTAEPNSTQPQTTSTLIKTSPPDPTSTTQPSEDEIAFFQIQQTLRSFPPCKGNHQARMESILVLNEYLKSNSAAWDPEVTKLYENMVQFVPAELSQPVTSSIRIWLMYNHGFIVKTPSTVFAFDLLHGYSSWDYQLPDALLKQIDVLFVSHRHGDHLDWSMNRAILDFGGDVVAPEEDRLIGYEMTYLAPGEKANLAGLQITAHDGVHGGIPVRIYEVRTPEGVTIVHTGDNQSADTLPAGLSADILLLNAWVNYGIIGSAIDGIPDSVNKIKPQLTILGHIHELGHTYDPGDIRSRFPFDIPLEVAEMDLPGEVSVQIWGERCEYPLE